MRPARDTWRNLEAFAYLGDSGEFLSSVDLLVYLA